MLFNSYTFLIFFISVLLSYYSLQSWQSRKLLLLITSYIFYAAWNPPFVILLWLSTIVDWYFAQSIHRANQLATKRLLLVGSLVVNLGMLFFFKYGNFLLENVQMVLGLAGIAYQPPIPNIILPVGISFYTFQTLSYTLDVYQQKAEPSHSFLDYALYVTFFPQLVAGPIVRATDFLYQCIEAKRFDLDNIGWGLSLMTLGLFQKTVIADALLAPITEKLYGTNTLPNFISAWIGTLAFTGQIFCDFAGYSTCAIGAALCLGFGLPDNFNFPYAAVGFSDFWRRWHISLSSWLRDYLYIPLGGNRRGSVRTQVNLMITMLLGGLWHGAAWTFVAWGGLHGLYLVIERGLKHSLDEYKIWRHPLMQFSLGMLTFILLCVTWVFFRATSFHQAWLILTAMFGIGTHTAKGLVSQEDTALTLAVIGCLLSLHWFFRNRVFDYFLFRLPWWATSPALAFMLYAIITMPSEDRAFIYFQF